MAGHHLRLEEPKVSSEVLAKEDRSNLLAAQPKALTLSETIPLCASDALEIAL